MSEIANLVWAKMKGYPWWPGIVKSIQEEFTYTKGQKVYRRVRFPTCNQQYESFSADFLEINVKEFLPNYDSFKDGSKNKVRPNQDFLLDLAHINSLVSHEVQKCEKPVSKVEPSQKLYTKNLPDIIQSPKKHDFLLQELKSITFNDRETSKPDPSSIEINKLRRNVSKAILEKDQSLLIESLIDVQKYCISKELLKSTKLVKILRYFIRNSGKNEEILFDGLLDITKHIFYRWKLVMIQSGDEFGKKNEIKKNEIEKNKVTKNEVTKVEIKKNELAKKEAMKGEIKKKEVKMKEVKKNEAKENEIKENEVKRPALRLDLILNTIRILNENGFDEKESESLAVKIEEGIRMRDPDMDERYKHLARAMLKDIRQLEKHSFQRTYSC